MNRDPNCIFCKIVAGEIPCRKAYEDDEMLVFHDIAPWAPVHVLVDPEGAHRARFYDVADAAHGDARPHDGAGAAADARARRDQRLPHPGQHRPRTARQEVQHLHMHVMGGPRPWAKG